jgi:hypothetical protein
LRKEAQSREMKNRDEQGGRISFINKLIVLQFDAFHIPYY